MSFGIIIRGKHEPSRSNHFRAHYNHAIGKMIHTKDDYLRELKENGLIPQKEAEQIAAAKRREMNKPYKPSKWAHEMTEHVRSTKGKVGTKFYDELAKRGYDVKKMAKAQSKNKKRAEQITTKGDFND